MARPQSTGIPYFPVVTEWDQKLKLVRAKFGLLGVGCIVELWKAIYSEGYALAWDDDARLLFADENSLPLEQLEAIVSFAVDKGIFDSDTLENHRVLTSHGIQKQWLTVVRKAHRTDSDIAPELCLLTPDERSLDKVERKPRDGVPKYSDNPANAPKSSEETTQSKAKQSKAKESKAAGKQVSSNPASAPESSACLRFDIQELRTKIAKAPFPSTFSDADYEAFAQRLAMLGLDARFLDYCIDRVARDRKTTKPPGQLKAAVLKYDDWAKEYRASMNSGQESAKDAPMIEACPTCGETPRVNLHIGEAYCSTCHRGWTYSWDWQMWNEDPEEKIS